MNETIRWLGLGVVAVGYLILQVGWSLGWSKKRTPRGLAWKLVGYSWMIGTVLIVGGFILVFLSF